MLPTDMDRDAPGGMGAAPVVLPGHAPVPAAAGQSQRAAAENAGRPTVLFVTRDSLMHTFQGAIVAAHNLLSLLQRQGVPVTMLVTGGRSRSSRLLFRRTAPLPEGVRLVMPGYWRVGSWYVAPLSLRAWGRAVLRLLKRRPAWQTMAERALAGLGVEVSALPWDLSEPTAGEAALVQQTVRSLRPDAVIANYAFWGPVLGPMGAKAEGGKPRRLILMHDILSDHVRSFEEKNMPLDCIPIAEATELAWLRSADTLIAVQQEEADAVRARLDTPVLVQPISMAVEAASSEPGPLRCLFVGSNSPPNVQGLQWMMGEVWPHVLRAEPGAVLAVAGTACGRVQGAPGVELLGPVLSLAEVHREAAVCVVPLLVGSGLKIKLLDALSFGKATVSTRVGVQGVEAWVDGVVAVTDDAERFAAEIVRLLRDPKLRREREAGATALMRQHFAAGSEREQALLRALR